jgi:Zn-dependent M28 family amino/carboxypeptidase
MKKYSSLFKIVLVFSILVTFGTISSAEQSGLKIAEQVTGELAYDHVVHMSENIGARLAGTANEENAADYIMQHFENMGYEVQVQPFTFYSDTLGGDYLSQNIIATKPGKIDQTVIIGAHYDSAADEICSDGNYPPGTGDNASGVGVMLEVAEILANYKTHGNIVFVAFGAEEEGLWGSEYYASQMSNNEVANTVTMINLDSVGAGDFFYVYAGKDDNPGWARDLALKIGQRMGYNLRTSPGLACYEWGTAGDWSDHVPFRMLGIPIAYFEWMNWDADPCGGIETEEFGWIMHSCLDNLDYTSITKIEMTADVVASLAFQLSKTKLPKAEKGKVAKGNKFIRFKKRTPLYN